MTKIRVMIVEDSPTVRELLRHIINTDPRLEVVRMVSSGEEAIKVLEHVAPDVISMDINLPGMNGLDTTRRIMERRPTPIVVVSSYARADDAKFTIEALRAGALSVVEKPGGESHAGYAGMAGRLCTQLIAMSQVRVVRQRSESKSAQETKPLSDVQTLRRNPDACLGIVASTGGPRSLSKVLEGIGETFPMPVLLVQHMVASFMPAFALWLNDNCSQSVVTVEAPVVPKPGFVYLAPADHNLKMSSGRVWADNRSTPSAPHMPSGDVLLQSIANNVGSIGVILTGMGADGADGLLAMRRAGRHTIAEDEATAIVYGMPQAAVRLGAVCDSLPLEAIAPRLKQIAARQTETVQK